LYLLTALGIISLPFVFHTLRASDQIGGITNDPDRVAPFKGGGWKRAQYRHTVFYRDAQACHRCGDWTRKISVASRRLYLCPTCQPSVR